MIDDSFLEAKKRLVESLTRQFEKLLGLDTDSVTINYCEGYTSLGREALACIQPETRNMQISLIHLNNMSKEEIKKTVAHELIHIFEREHTPTFYKLLNELLMGAWTPEGATGIVSINGGKHVDKKPKKAFKEEIDKAVCNKHSCDSKNNLKRCIHCKGYYCERHLNPIPPSFPNFDYPNKFYEWKNKEKGHPCVSYVDYLNKKEKERKMKYELALKSNGKVKYISSLDTELSSPNISREAWNKDSPLPELEKPGNDFFKPKMSKKKKILIGTLLIFIILLLLVFAGVLSIP